VLRGVAPKRWRISIDSGAPEPQHFLYGLLVESRDHLLVTVAQLAEHRVVVPKVAGSSPVGHPPICRENAKLGSGIFSMVHKGSR